MNFTINPDNLQKEADGSYPIAVIERVPITIHSLIIYVLFLSLPGAFLLKNKKQGILQTTEKNEPLRKEINIEPTIAFQTFYFYLLIILFSSSVMLGFGVLSNYKSIQVGMSD